jgi:hypothetical protein
LNSFISRPLGAITPAANVHPVAKEIGGDSAAVIQARYPLSSTSLESPKTTRCSARSKGYHSPCKQFSSAKIPAEWAVTGDNK